MIVRICDKYFVVTTKTKSMRGVKLARTNTNASDMPPKNEVTCTNDILRNYTTWQALKHLVRYYNCNQHIWLLNSNCRPANELCTNTFRLRHL